MSLTRSRCPRRTRSVVSITCSRPLMSDTSLRISIERSTAMSSRTFPRGSTGAKRMSGREYRCLLTRAWFLVGAVMAATKAKPAVPLVASGNVIRGAFWVGVALAFGIWIADARGTTAAAAAYYAAYLLELSLSVDNIFVFVTVFSELHIPAEHQRRVLAWGVTGALVFRAVMITAGITLIQRFEWIMYPFGALILFAAWRMLFAEERERRVVAGACDVCSTWIARVVRVSPVLDGHQFWRRE